MVATPLVTIIDFYAQLHRKPDQVNYALIQPTGKKHKILLLKHKKIQQCRTFVIKREYENIALIRHSLLPTSRPRFTRSRYGSPFQ